MLRAVLAVWVAAAGVRPCLAWFPSWRTYAVSDAPGGGGEHSRSELLRERSPGGELVVCEEQPSEPYPYKVVAVGSDARAAVLRDAIADAVTAYHTQFMDVYINGLEEVNVTLRGPGVSFVARPGQNVERAVENRPGVHGKGAENATAEPGSSSQEGAGALASPGGQGEQKGGSTASRESSTAASSPDERRRDGEVRPASHAEKPDAQAKRSGQQKEEQGREPQNHEQGVRDAQSARQQGTHANEEEQETQLARIDGFPGGEDSDQTIPIPKREPPPELYLYKDTVDRVKQRLRYRSPEEAGLPFQVPRTLSAPVPADPRHSLKSFYSRLVEVLDSDFSQLARLGTLYAGRCQHNPETPRYVTLYAACVPEREAALWFAEQRSQANKVFGDGVTNATFSPSDRDGRAPSDAEAFRQVVGAILKGEEGASDGIGVEAEGEEGGSGDGQGAAGQKASNAARFSPHYISSGAHDYRCGLLEFAPSPDLCSYIALLGCPRLCAIPELGKQTYDLLESSRVVCRARG